MDSDRNTVFNLRYVVGGGSMKTRTNDKGMEQVWYAGAWRSKESLDRKREQQAKHKKELYHSSEEEKLRIKTMRKKSRDNNLESERQRNRENYERNKSAYNERRVQWARENPDQQRETFRQWYAKNRQEYNSKERSRRDERNPARVIRRTVGEIKSGVIGLDEAIKTMRKSVAKAFRNVRD